MNINSNEILLLAKKNIKFRGEAEPAPKSTTVPEPTATNPQSRLNALDAQGQNNIAFQGVKIPAQIKNKGLGAMMALSLFAATSLTSCDESEPKIYEIGPDKIEQTVIVDMTAITNMFNMMFQMWQDMLEQHKMTNEQLILLNTQMQQLLATYQAGQITANEFYNRMYEFMATNEANQQAMISIMVQNGKTQEEAVAFLQKIFAEVEAGNMTAAEAYTKILNELGQVNDLLKDIKAQLASIQEKMTTNHDEYMAIKEEELKYLANLYKQGKITKEQLDKLIKNTKSMDEKLGNIEINTKDMIAIIKDETKFNELKEVLKGLKPADIDYAKFEEMFKIYGLSVENVIGMSADQLEAALKSFIDFYRENEGKQTEQLTNISNQIALLNMFPGLDSEALADAFAALEKAINNNTDAVTGELGDIQTQLDKIQATLDNMFKQLGKLSNDVSTYNQIFAKNWTTALGKLDDLIGSLKDIKAALHINNTLLANVDTNTEALKDAQNVANGYLKALLDKADEIKKLIAEFEAATGNGGMTIDEFKAYMQERDAAQYEKFVKFTIDMGFDKLPGDVSTIKDLLGELNDKVQSIKDYSGQLDTIIGKLNDLANWLKNADMSNPDYTAKLDRIIELLENIKHNCECGTGDKVDDNEGIVGDLGDIFG